MFLKDRLFPLFEGLGQDEELKIELKKMNCSRAGVIYVLDKWNKDHSDKLLVHLTDLNRDDPTMYVSLKIKENKMGDDELEEISFKNMVLHYREELELIKKGKKAPSDLFTPNLSTALSKKGLWKLVSGNKPELTDKALKILDG